MADRTPGTIRLRLLYRLWLDAEFLVLICAFVAGMVWNWKPSGQLASLVMLVFILPLAPLLWFRKELHAAFGGDEEAIEAMVSRGILERTDAGGRGRAPPVE